MAGESEVMKELLEEVKSLAFDTAMDELCEVREENPEEWAREALRVTMRYFEVESEEEAREIAKDLLAAAATEAGWWDGGWQEVIEEAIELVDDMNVPEPETMTLREAVKEQPEALEPVEGAFDTDAPVDLDLTEEQLETLAKLESERESYEWMVEAIKEIDWDQKLPKGLAELAATLLPDVVYGTDIIWIPMKYIKADTYEEALKELKEELQKVKEEYKKLRAEILENGRETNDDTTEDDETDGEDDREEPSVREDIVQELLEEINDD